VPAEQRGGEHQRDGGQGKHVTFGRDQGGLGPDRRLGNVTDELTTAIHDRLSFPARCEPRS
jgi:hypothetical protein